MVYSYDPEVIQTYNKGSLLITAEITAKARVLLTESCTKLEQHGYIVLYYDTDSILGVPARSKVNSLDQILTVSSRLGDLKYEEKNITYFVAHQAKSYMYCTSENTIVLKSKGFHLFQTILQRTGHSNLLGEMLVDLLELYLVYGQDSTRMSVAIPQPGLELDLRTWLPKLSSEEKVKKLKFNGPKRQILLPAAWYAAAAAAAGLAHPASPPPKRVKVIDVPRDVIDRLCLEFAKPVESGLLISFPFGFQRTRTGFLDHLY